MRVVGGNATGAVVRSPGSLRARYDLVTNESIETIVNRQLQDSLVGIQRLRDGYGSATFLIVGVLAEYVLKVHVFSDVEAPNTDATFYHLAQTIPGVPVPKPLVVDSSGALLPFPYLVVSYIPGRSFASLLEDGVRLNVPRLVGQVGGLLARLHTADLRARLHDLPVGLPVPPSRRGLVHGDPSLRNFLVCEGEIAAVIDGHAVRGTAYLDVAKALVFIALHVGNNQRDAVEESLRAFLGSYTAVAPAAFLPSSAQVQSEIERRLRTSKQLDRAEQDLGALENLRHELEQGFLGRQLERLGPP